MSVCEDDPRWMISHLPQPYLSFSRCSITVASLFSVSLCSRTSDKPEPRVRLRLRPAPYLSEASSAGGKLSVGLLGSAHFEQAHKHQHTSDAQPATPHTDNQPHHTQPATYCCHSTAKKRRHGRDSHRRRTRRHGRRTCQLLGRTRELLSPTS